MTGENSDKRPNIPGETPYAGESADPVQADPMKEQDMDELSHNNLEEKADPTKEMDEDDLVHKIKPEAPPAMNSEKDPDDLVHGNQ